MITKPSPPLPALARRSVCVRCCRPTRTCICRWAVPLASAVEVVILQHPLEVSHPKGSARLLHLSLPGSRLVVGESFTEAELQALLYGPLGAQEEEARQPVLLYPKTEDAPLSLMRQARDLDPDQLRLIVLDGTWRKSRRMMHAHPLLQRLPRLALQNLPPSRYRIRQAYRPHQLSTLEAACHALAQIEDNAPKYQPLLDAFDAFIDDQQNWFKGMPAGADTSSR